MTPAPDRRWFSFSIRTLFVVLMDAGAASFALLRYLDGRRGIQWQEFSRDAVRFENANGRDILVSFLAEWDSSNVIQHHEIDTPTVRRLIRAKGVIPMRANWTRPELAIDISKELASLGRTSIPLLVIYPASGQKPIILPFAINTAEEVAAALRQLPDP